MSPRLLWWLAPLVLVAVRLHNAEAFPFHQGFDNYGHVLNLRKIVLEGTLPLANDGFSGYHPPLYYLASGLLWRLLGSPEEGPWKAAQFLNTLASLGLLGCVWASARRLARGAEWFAVTALAALPVELTMAPMILNVPLAGFWSGLFLLVLLRAWPRPRPVLWEEAALGLLAGAACLTRMDALSLVLVLGLLALHRLRRGPFRAEALLAAGFALSLVGAVVGWFYLRNLAEFGRLVVVNGHGDCFPFWGITETLPGFRTMSFYLGGDLALLARPDFPSQTPYLLGMEYASTWWDHLRFFSSDLDPGRGPVLLALGVVPTLLALVGLWSTLADRDRRATWSPVLACFLAPLALHLVSVALVPLYSVVKPIYLFAAFAPGALLVTAGALQVRECSPRLDPWLRGAVTLLAAASAATFWYPG